MQRNAPNGRELVTQVFCSRSSFIQVANSISHYTHIASGLRRPNRPSMTDTREAAEGNRRAVAGVSDMQVVGALSEEVIFLLGVQSSARIVWLHNSAVDHIVVRRGLTQPDASYVMEHLVATILRPHFCGPDPSDERRVSIVRNTEPGRYVCVSLKFVSAAEAHSAIDEIWVSTAFPMGSRFLTRKRWVNRFKRVTRKTD